MVDVQTDAMVDIFAAMLSKELIQILWNKVFDVQAKALVKTLT